MADKRFRHAVTYHLVRFMYNTISILPRRLTLFLGETLGLLTYLMVPKERHKAITNLDRAYGDEKTYREKKNIARGSFITFGRAALEAMRIKKHFHSQMFDDIEVIGRENFEKAYERGNGVIAFTAHIGNFELLAAWVAQTGHKTAVVVRKLFEQRFDEMLVANRAKLGIVTVMSDDSPRRILNLLKDQHVIGFLIDTDSFRVAGELTPFFGRPAKTPIGPTQLGLITKSSFVPFFCLSLPKGKYRLIIGEELEIEDYKRSRENIFQITSRMTAEIEKLIRQYPEQWIWMHNRWHTRPEGDDSDFLSSQGLSVK
ncbi:MAG: lysophospholipid acyltransferase family protein [candidate division Zixibacteria bacterium]|nr:lysophospholipid acyltransferase family protein [candidate division Zixibacteria bacterium]